MSSRITFTPAETAAWNRNLEALIGRVSGPGQLERVRAFRRMVKKRRAAQTNANQSIGFWPVR